MLQFKHYNVAEILLKLALSTNQSIWFEQYIDNCGNDPVGKNCENQI